jgi:hypothetical protein
MKNYFSIPHPFLVSPFYELEGDIQFPKDQLSIKDLLNYPFVIDMFGQDHFDLKPWENPTVSGQLILNHWENGSFHISELFSCRKNDKAKELMIIYIAAFIDFLFWTNGKKVRSLQTLKDDINELQDVPININERLFFIIDKANHYNSYIQLKHLFVDVNKQFEIACALNKIKK